MAFVIKPSDGLEGLSFRSPRDEVRKFFGSSFSAGRRTQGSRPYDYWAEVPVFGYYDEADLLEALEFPRDADLVLDGTSLFRSRATDTVQFLRERDPALLVEEQGTSVTSERLGLGLWIPEASEPDAAVESVIIFCDGYYSN
ncbi:hypothetical protein [Neorhizobium alkalisoli]|uniref:hypothetical protein n=1 Tax=Neorhizobium alkalisoli TaxID=528178 RepID=UPI00119E7D3B|nr:hypothetical protein [Neorhizobium alkalisoli]